MQAGVVKSAVREASGFDSHPIPATVWTDAVATAEKRVRFLHVVYAAPTFVRVTESGKRALCGGVSGEATEGTPRDIQIMQVRILPRALGK